MQELESQIENEIAVCESDKLRELWLQYLRKKNEKLEKFVTDLETKSSAKGAVIGFFIGSLFDK